MTQVGKTLTTTDGTWTGNPTFTYEWRRCSPDPGTNCTSIPSANANQYVLTNADLDHYVRARVTATNSGGSAAASQATDKKVTADAPPTLITGNKVSGSTKVGQTLTTTDGTWTGNPTFTYEWRRCSPDPGTNCTTIPTANANQYMLTNADLGSYIRARVTATNSAGSAATSQVTDKKVSAEDPPVLVAGNKISGSTRVGQTLTTTDGTWTGSPTFTYEWRRCSPDPGTNCSTIPSANTNQYVLTNADLDHYIRARVTATNSGGSAAASEPTKQTITP